MEADCLNEREKAAVLWAEHVTKNTARNRDDIFEIIKKVYSESEIVELTAISCLFNLVNRFQDSLQVQLEDEDEVNKIKKSVQVDTDKLQSYVTEIINDWPKEFPEPIHFGRAVRWLESEVQLWIKDQVRTHRNSTS